MAIDIRLKWSGNEDGADGSSDNATRSNTVAFTAVTTNRETAMQVRAAILEGRIGNAHAEDFSMRVRSARVRQVSPIYFEGEISYEGEGANQNDRPEDQHPEISITLEKVDEPIDQDANGNPIQTRAGESFDPPLTRRFTDRVYSIKKKVREFNAAFFDQYNDVVNSDQFLGYEPGQCLMDGISGQLAWDEDYEYWEIEAVVRVRQPPAGTHAKKTWFRRIRHEGYYCLFRDTDGKLKRARRVDEFNEPVAVPMPLTDTGEAQDDPEKPAFIEFKVFTTMPFADLHLMP